MLEIGCGTGRVALDLARAGHVVTAIDSDSALTGVLDSRARERGLDIAVRAGDARSLDLGERFALILVPMQMLQLLADAGDRQAVLAAVRRHLAQDGHIAVAIVEGVPAGSGAPAPPLPDVAEIDGWVYSSLPLDITEDGDTMLVTRLRQVVSPAGDLTETVDETRLCVMAPGAIDAEAAAAGPARRGAAHDRVYRRARRIHRGRAGGCVMPQLRLLTLYPEQMNIYADRGNILFLQRRCEWRGIGFRHESAGPGDAVDAAAHDLIYIGGGQDRDQRLVAADMVATKRDGLAAASADGAVVLAVCGGYQLLGHSYQLGEERIAGLGIADLETVRSDGPRLIGNIAIEVDLGTGPRTIAGFENHGGRTHLGTSATPLGRVLEGHGNNGKDGFEGIRQGNLIGTYMHGPLLPKNAWLADRLIQLALARREGAEPELEPLDDTLEDAAHTSALAAARRG